MLHEMHGALPRLRWQPVAAIYLIVENAMHFSVSHRSVPGKKAQQTTTAGAPPDPADDNPAKTSVNCVLLRLGLTTQHDTGERCGRAEVHRDDKTHQRTPTSFYRYGCPLALKLYYR